VRVLVVPELYRPDDGKPVLECNCALGEVVFALRRRGYADTGSAGTSVFEKREGG